MKTKERNTDSWRKERIWVHTVVDSMWFNHNDRYKTNTPEKTLAFITRAVDKAAKEGYEDVTVEPYSTEPDEGSLGSSYIKVYGWREETNKEYRARLNGMINREKYERENWERKEKFYATNGGHDARIAELKTAVSEIKDPEECH